MIAERRPNLVDTDEPLGPSRGNPNGCDGCLKTDDGSDWDCRHTAGCVAVDPKPMQGSQWTASLLSRFLYPPIVSSYLFEQSLLDSKPKVPGMTVTPITDLPDVSQRRFKRPEIRRPQSAANAPKGQVHGSPSSILAGPAPLSTRFSAVDTNSEGSNQGGIAGQSVGEPSSMSVGANIANKRKLDDSTTRGLPNPPANGFQRRLGKQPEQGGASGPMDDGAFSRQPKRTKKGGYSEFEGADPAGGSTPSLLSRMRAPPNGSAYQSSRPLNQRSSPMSTNTNHHHNPQRPSKTDGLGGDAFPSEDAADGGFRIKGAATQPDIVTSSSLLHRIGDDSGMGLGSLGGGPNNGFQGGDGARHKRKYKQR